MNITVLNPVPAVEHPAPVLTQRTRRLFRVAVGVFGLVVTFANWTLGAWGVLTGHPAVVQYAEFSFVMTNVAVLTILGSTMGTRGFRAGLQAAGVLGARRTRRH